MTRNSRLSERTALSNPAARYRIVRNINEKMSQKMDRQTFFGALSDELRTLMQYDRMTINLYDSSTEILSYFTTADGLVVSALSNLRHASKRTVAGMAITSRKPVILRDLTKELDSIDHPMAEAGLKSTIAYPLVSRDRVVGTLHCSFREEPANLMEIVEFFAELSPQVAMWVDNILVHEQIRRIERGHVEDVETPFVDDKDAPIYESETMLKVMRQVRRIAKLDVPIMLTGETGTGKTMLARYIHMESNRHKNQFVKVNCPALVPTLFESEMFGHGKGAFTGAGQQRVGRVEMARGGTLFLDEIGELSMELQSKLLHVLEENSFERVGESKSIQADFRLISATNIDLEKAMEEGVLRRDLYFRLSPMMIELPPLRDRRDDIPLLAKKVSGILANQMNVPDIKFTMGIMGALQNYSWPGNIRELRNVISRLLIINLDKAIEMQDVRNLIGVGVQGSHTGGGFPTIKEMEKRHIEEALQLTRGTLSGPTGAAKLLGMPRTTLQYRIRKLGIDLTQFSA